jgi:hypothetical protein
MIRLSRVAGTVVAAIAVPDTPANRQFVDRISRPLEQLGIGAFWVDAPNHVRLTAPSSLAE